MPTLLRLRHQLQETGVLLKRRQISFVLNLSNALWSRSFQDIDGLVSLAQGFINQHCKIDDLAVSGSRVQCLVDLLFRG